MRGTDKIERFAHHFTQRELIDLCTEAGFKVKRVTLDTTETPNGKREIENIILIAIKPMEVEASAA